MRLDLGHAKELLSKFAPAGTIEYRLNRVCERALNDGKFIGSLARIAIVIRYGQMALPTRYRTMEGYKLDGRVRDINGLWWSFLPGRWSSADFTSDAEDLGDGWAALYDLPSGGDLTATGAMIVYGNDTSGLEITHTFSGAGTIANPFTKINRVHKEQGVSSVSLTHVAADTTQTPMVLLGPKEEESLYRRYRIGSLTTTETATAETLMKLRHIEFTADTDVLEISNISALENGLLSLQYESEQDQGLAETYWGRMIALLNAELKEINAADQLPNIRMHYPGGTTPKLTSFM